MRLDGFLGDRETRAGLAGLRVEVHLSGRTASQPWAESTTDEGGAFGLDVLTDGPIAANGDGGIEVEFRVLERDRLLHSELREVRPGTHGERIELLLSRAEHDASTHVRGRVHGRAPAGSTVRAVVRRIENGGLVEHVVGEASVAENRWYELDYAPPSRDPEGAPEALLVRLHEPGGELLVESAPQPSPASRMRIDLRPPRSARPSELALLEDLVRERLDRDIDVVDGLDGEGLDELAEWLEIDTDRLALLQGAHTLEAATGIERPVFYALGRYGVPLSLEDLIEIPISELSNTIRSAVTDEVVDPSVLEDLDATLARLSEVAIEGVLSGGRPAVHAGLAEVLAAAELSEDTMRTVLRRYHARTGSAAEALESLRTEDGENEAIDESVAEALEVAVEVGALVGVDPPLLRRLHQMRREGRWRATADLAELDFDDWCELLEETDGEGVSEDDAEERGEWIEDRAEAILDALEEAFPSRFIRHELLETEEIAEPARRVLQRVPEHDFLRGSIRTRAAAEPALLEGIEAEAAEAAIDEIEAVERIARVTPRAEEVTLLVATGMRSAKEIAEMPVRHFGDLYGEALGGRAQAARVHAQAQQGAAAATLAMVQLLQALQQNPLVLTGGINAIQAARDNALKEIPDARALFGTLGLCGCEHCGSVYSPAAYFVDLLRYLDVRDPKRLRQVQARLETRGYPPAQIASLSQYQPLDALLLRRPDLADIPLTCENTLTPLPYIDLVNELLEARVSGGNAAHDTGKTPADVLAAVPQYLDREAYHRLSRAVHPITMPFHEPLEVARAYLGHLGVARVDLMNVLARGPGRDAPLLAEMLRMSPDELALVAQAPQEPWLHFGLTDASPGAAWVDALAPAPAFMQAAGIGFQELIDLVSTRFINGDDAVKLESPAPDCDPAKVRIMGLDEARLSKMLRLLRLRRRLGWSFADLDRALSAFAASDLDAAVLRKLVEARDLAKDLDRPIVEILALWAPIDTQGDGSLFDRLLKTRAVAWRTGDTTSFQLDEARRELARPADDLDPVAPALLAAFRITHEELSAVRAILARRDRAPRLDLAGLSAVYRIVVLARALRLRVDQLDALLRMVPPSADPFTPGEPAATRRFVEIAKDVAASAFSPEQLAYLFRPVASPRRALGPTDAQVDAVLAGVRRGLADAYTETAEPAEKTSDVLRQKLAMLLDAALLDQAIEVLDVRTQLSPARRRELFDRHLAKIFSDPAAAAERIFGRSATAPAGEEHWRDTIAFVLENLLPRLRGRQIRGAVVQGLSDTLGTTSVAMARLIEHVMRSRRVPGRPLIADFYALLGSGLTGAYFANPELAGEPAVSRVDPRLDLSWTGAAPAAGVPAQRFSVRWSGRFLPHAKASHTFFAQTDGAVRLVITTPEGEQVLIDQPAGGGRVVEHASRPIELDPKHLYAIRIEYRNAGAPASFGVQYGTTPSSKQAIPTAQLYPEDGLGSFAPVAASYRRLHKAASIVTGFGITDAQLEWLTGEPRRLDLDALPMDPEADERAAVAAFGRWRQLAGLYAMHKRLPRAGGDVFAALRATTLDEAIDRLVVATGWDKPVLGSLIGPQGLALELADLGLPSDPLHEPAVLRLDRAMAIQRRLGVSPEVLASWANAPIDADVAASIVQAVKARYDEKRWLEVAKGLNDPLRALRRDALVGYLLPRMRDQGVTSRNQLFEFFLIDVDMNPCMLTSRIKQAISAVQTFFQRCLMNLESQVPARLIDARDWKWLKNYRVWEANRKVFLYPENWIEPELRDDKSPFFKELERTILQQEIKKENVESAFIDYLQRLDEVARLDVRAVWYESRKGPAKVADKPQPPGPPPSAPPSVHWDGVTYRSHWDDGTYHIFARTFDPPHSWFYRRLERGRLWTPWEKIDADIEGDHLVPLVFQQRMHLFWTIFREVTKPPLEPEKDAVPYKLGKDWEVSVAYSVYDRGRWTRKRMSSGAVVDDQRIFFQMATAQQTLRDRQQKKKEKAPRIEGSAFLPRNAYTLRGSVSDDPGRLRIYLYRRAVDQVRVSTMPSFPASAEEFLSRDVLDVVAEFGLDGCNGELDARLLGGRSYVRVAKRTSGKRPPPSLFGRIGVRKKKRPVVRTVVQVAAPQRPFQLETGGGISVPGGYLVDANGMRAARPRGNASLSLPAGPGRGHSLVLAKLDARNLRLLPIVDPSTAPDGSLSPFFLQDRRRSWFVRPVAAWIGERVQRVRVAQPLIGRRPIPFVPSFGRRTPKRPRTGRVARGRREAIEMIETPEAIPHAALARSEADDQRDDLEDEAWHADDADERRRPRPRRTRKRPPAKRAAPPAPRPPVPRPPAPRPAASPPPPPQFQLQRQAAHFDWRLRFVPFEHAASCRLLSALKSHGIDGLLSLSTTRPARGEDHDYVGGRWVRRSPSTFSRAHLPGPLVDDTHPSLDIDFSGDNPYALYNWELFFHAPLQVAIRLAKDGRHEESQRWFHFIFDPTVDASSPAPQRYWRFAPFHENTEYDSARELMALLSYDGSSDALIRKQHLVNEQVTAWWEKPFSPHVIARIRTSAYQKAVLMKYIDNLIEWGDKLFRRDTMESIQEATQLYILAAGILGPRPERVPPMVKVEPVTFRSVRGRLDAFANWVVRFENNQVRRPFRINARPDVGGASSVLGMATQYFCIPANPQMDKYWDTVADRLFKIRNCMNIKGVVRQLALFEPPIDPGALVRAAAAGADLGSVAASLNAPPPSHRFRVLFTRALRVAEELRGFGKATLEALERRDAEVIAALRTSQETALLTAIRDVSKTKIKQVEEEIVSLALEREHVDMQIRHVFALAQELMNPQEAARQESLTAAQVIAGVAEGIDLVSKVLYAIPDFQAGVAGGFSSPFTTLQLGGQMFGDISAAVAESFFKVMNKFQTEAEMAAAQAEYQRRQAELVHQYELLEKEKEAITKRIGETNLKLEIANADLRRHDLAVESSKQTEAHLRDKYTNAELYGWMLGQLATVHFQAYKLAFDSAKLAERALRFERGEPSAHYIEFSYWDSFRKGLHSGDRLLVDLRRMEAAYLENDTRALEITRHVSLRDDAPTTFQELLATGVCKLNVSEALLDGDFPGHYFRRIKTVAMSVVGATGRFANVNCTLTLLENRIRTSANASGSYEQGEDSDDSRFLMNFAPIQAIATSRPEGDAGMFELRFDDDRYLPFEGAGAISTWRIELRQADNAIDLGQLSDVVLSLSYSARSGGAPLEASARASRDKALSRGKLDPPPCHRVSLRRDVPGLWAKLAEAAPEKDVALELPLGLDRLSGRYRGYGVRIERVTAYAHARAAVGTDALRLQVDPPKGSGSAIGAWTRPWPGSSMLRGTAESQGAPGLWKLAIGARAGKVPDVFDDVVLVFDLGARKG